MEEIIHRLKFLIERAKKEKKRKKRIILQDALELILKADDME